MVRPTLPAAETHDRIATLDIETTHYEADEGEVVAIGVGHYDFETGDCTLDVLSRATYDEATLVSAAYEWLTDTDAEAVVTYNGAYFDFEFLDARQRHLGSDATLPLRDSHVDLMPPRQRLADERGEKWPSLEESLDAYDLPTFETTWNGDVLTNTRFGEEFGPAYLDAALGDGPSAEMERPLRSYVLSDVEANVALYGHDTGRPYVPRYSY